MNAVKSGGVIDGSHFPDVNVTNNKIELNWKYKYCWTLYIRVTSAHSSVTCGFICIHRRECCRSVSNLQTMQQHNADDMQSVKYTVRKPVTNLGALEEFLAFVGLVHWNSLMSCGLEQQNDKCPTYVLNVVVFISYPTVVKTTFQ